jgi:chromosome segregation ATPase
MEARHRAVPAGQALVLYDGGTDAWRERALAAEARAEKASAMLRTKMLPHLARGVVQEFAQRLVSQRREILTEHQTAEQEVAELADRLQQVHAPLEERLRAYEKRIAELEAELAEKGEQNLALIRARIDSTRQKLESERADTVNLG